MARLGLITGPAGSGKTELVLNEAAQASLDQPLGPPLLIIVPEQQGVQTERAALQRIARLRGSADGTAASSRIRVLSLSRLARLLEERSGRHSQPLSELQRRLLVWRLLEPGREREARAQVYSDLLAELALWQTRPEELEQCSAQLSLQAAAAAELPLRQKLEQLSAKLSTLAALQRRYIAACEAQGLDFRPAPARIPELLSEENWPGLSRTRVWVDGFAGFTPAEESALQALLKHCESVSATVLLDPRRRYGPLESDTRDWYAPGRALLERWQLLAQRSAAAQTQLLELPQPQAWPPGHPLGQLALELPQAGMRIAAAEQDEILAVACADERQEVEAAAQHIRELLLPPESGGRGIPAGRISVVLRSVEHYAPLIRNIFHDYEIPFFLDQRRSLAHHPAVELLRSGLRLALGLAGQEDIAALLRCGLLPAPEDESLRAAADALLAYARRHGLRPGLWLSDSDWRFSGGLLGSEESLDDERLRQREESLARLNAWRRKILAPIAALSRRLRGLERPRLRELLACAWEELFSAATAQQMESWALQAQQRSAGSGREASYMGDKAQLHRAVWPALAALLDALDAVAGEERMEPAEVCAWLEAGLAALDTGFPPPLLDTVLVTQIDRGRHGSVDATLLLGLSEDLWPPAQAESALFSDLERELINAGPEGGGDSDMQLLAAGARQQAQREPWFFLVAITRPARHLYLSRPASSADGQLRPASAYLRALLDSIGLQERGAEQLCAERLERGSLYLPPAELAARLAGAEPGLLSALPQLERLLLAQAPDALSAVRWSQAEYQRRGQPLPLDAPTLELLFQRTGQTRLRASASQLEAFALCPFRHYSRYLLRLSEEQPPLFDARTMGSFYHSLFEGLVRRLQVSAAQESWAAIDSERIEAEAAEVLSELGAVLKLETDYQRIDFLLLRARAILAQHAQLLAAMLAEGRVPLAAELAFGEQPGSQLPPLRLDFPGGELLLSGKIDRLDRDSQGQASVVDYKLGQRSFKDMQLLAGAQIQMYVYLLALAQGEAGRRPAQLELELRPHSACYQSIEPSWADSGLKLNASQRELASAEDGEWEAASRAGAAQKLRPSLELVRRLLSGIAADIASGSLAVSPLRDGPQWRACSSCDFRSVCRFDPLSQGQYRSTETVARRNLQRSGLNPRELAREGLARPRGGGR